MGSALFERILQCVSRYTAIRIVICICHYSCLWLSHENCHSLLYGYCYAHVVNTIRIPTNRLLLDFPATGLTGNKALHYKPWHNLSHDDDSRRIYCSVVVAGGPTCIMRSRGSSGHVHLSGHRQRRFLNAVMKCLPVSSRAGTIAIEVIGRSTNVHAQIRFFIHKIVLKKSYLTNIAEWLSR